MRRYKKIFIPKKKMEENLVIYGKSSTFAANLCRRGQNKQAKRVVSPRGQTRLIQNKKCTQS